MNPLDTLGWRPSLQDAFDAFCAHWTSSTCDPEQLLAARVLAQHRRDRYDLQHAGGPSPGLLPGRLIRLGDAFERPSAGDWVVCAPTAGDAEGPLTIVGVLPRVTCLARQAAGKVTRAQVIAANVDTFFVVTGLDGPVKRRRQERYLAAIAASGAEAVLVLNKVDACVDLALALAALGDPGCEVVALSALHDDTLDVLSGWLQPGRTIGLIGASGVGKSTIANRLMGGAVQDTGAVRATDTRGRHTTTHRQLLQLPSGALLMDTPGMRELALWAHEDGAKPGGFDELGAVADRCRFRDCRHEGEPGCAVEAAIEAGELEEERLEHWQQLEREQERQRAKQDARARAEQRAKHRRFARSVRHMKYKRS